MAERQHFAIGLVVNVREGAVPPGLDPEEWANNGWTPRAYPIDDVHVHESVPGADLYEVGGWYWDPTDLTVVGR